MEMLTMDESRFSPAENTILAIAKASNLSIAASSASRDLGSLEILAEWGMRPADGDADFSAAGLKALALDPPAKRGGASRIEYARRHMPCVKALQEIYAKEKIFEGARIAACLILEPKTAVLALALKEMGAELELYCGASSVDQETAFALSKLGVPLRADASNTPEEDHENALKMLDSLSPQILLDDGAGITRLLHMERPGLAEGLWGIAEETTCGVAALEAMEAEGELKAPAVAVNDMPIKTMFDNAHGTGETVVAVLLDLAQEGAKDKKACVAGYGPVGFGVAKRLRALGAEVSICEVSHVRALQALHDGYQVKPLLEAAKDADWIVTASGVMGTITGEALLAAKDGAIIASAGGALREIDVDGAIALGAELDKSDPDRWTLFFNKNNNKNQKGVRILSRGHGINYTSGGGNPIEIMDLSFAGQLEALAHIIKNKGNLPRKVIRLPLEASEEIARIKLESMNVAIDLRKQASSWRKTRFAPQGG
ncbi:MAG: adenosylhomocysteinase [Clostridiales bacterium]|nr:adenosylhomocysteinase [Clostridiales bacterium]